MTDKQIQTDKEQITCDCKYCMENPTCYKESLEEQLALKTQEYDDLLEQHKELDGRVNRMIEEKYSLARECEELRVAYNKAQDIIGRVNNANELKSYSLEESIKECDRYRKALEEIEEIACNEMCDILGHFCASCDGKSTCETLKILNVIKEVKREE